MLRKFSERPGARLCEPQQRRIVQSVEILDGEGQERLLRLTEPRSTSEYWLFPHLVSYRFRCVNYPR